MQHGMEESFIFANSSDLHIPVSLKIDTLHGFQEPIPSSILLKRPDLRYKGSNTSPHSELYVSVRLWADSKPLTVPVHTSYKVFKASRTWGEWLSLPVDYSNLPATAQLAITTWDLSPAGGKNSRFHAVPFGGTTIPLFDKDGTLQTGRQRCKIYRNREADGWSSTTTPNLPAPKRRENGKLVHEQADAQALELERLELLMKEHEMGEIPENPWLDQLTYRQIEKLERSSLKSRVQAQQADARKRAKEAGDSGTHGGSNGDAEEEDCGIFHLYIDFPRFDHPIVFADHEYPAPQYTRLQSSFTADIQLKPPPELSFGPGIDADGNRFDNEAHGPLIRIYDPEVGHRENPVEIKHRRLLRSHRLGVVDRDLKPNAAMRDALQRILSYGPLHQMSEPDKDAVWKFRHHLTREKKSLTKFLKSVNWTDAREVKQATQLLPRWTSIDVDDALELLGPQFDHPAVRAYAVDRLGKSDDEELLLYLLQLVQALKFEKKRVEPEESVEEEVYDSSLATFLITRAAKNFKLGNYLHWYLMVECEDRSAQQSPEHRELFARVEYDFMAELMKTPEGIQDRKILLRQGELITVLSKISKDIRASRLRLDQKVDRLKHFMADPKNELITINPPMPLPLDPTVMIIGVFPEESSVFKSSLNPLKITFKKADGTKYPFLFKTGDDLRQDQLVIQIIMLMDRLLKNENLDLKLSPYHILATGPYAGAVQFVPSTPLQNIGSILDFLKKNNPDSKAPLGVRKETMETYIKSCAGYCVITYILGVGDRHNDNLLLSPNGNFFHADFGYILGRDPKPFAPLMKLSKDMVDAMGGTHHEYYHQFKQYCFTAYASLRKSANLILNLFALMSEANIPDIRIEPDKAVQKVQDRFLLDKSDQDAVKDFEMQIDTSLTAMMPVVIDRMHAVTQRFNW
ncbi:phosphatidylinositol 3-kinase catalytic subunit [Tothia fuscella]|uniref:Phosphatidylinositol 3-kinase VPS34 n=1 Tax=Tothia fuscella TaxID=1048955 RepID=A0A9P4U2V1_9PEZI|nr:phosphatidylinositol 3-kinase catalytic subunit [Tothia fuscella]